MLPNDKHNLYNSFFSTNIRQLYLRNFSVLVQFTDFSNQANLLLINLKEVIGKLQAERNYFKIQAEKLQIEKQQLVISNQNLSKKVVCLEEELKTTIAL